MPILSKDIVAL